MSNDLTPFGASTRRAYALASADATVELQQLQNALQDDTGGDPLLREQALISYFLGEAAKANNVVMVKDLTATLIHLQKAREQSRLRSSQLLSKAAVRRVCQAIIDAVSEELQDVEDSEEIIDRICSRMRNAIGRAKNLDSDLK